MNKHGEKLTRWQYEQLAHQIEREDGLINIRIGWMLTFEGFLFTALALAGNSTTCNAAFINVLRYVFSSVGIFVGFLALLAVKAALSALEDLKKLWERGQYPDGYPQPFGKNKSHSHGAFYSQGLPIMMIGTWIFVCMVLK